MLSGHSDSEQGRQLLTVLMTKKINASGSSTMDAFITPIRHSSWFVKVTISDISQLGEGHYGSLNKALLTACLHRELKAP
jgi:hypothetical protein